MTPALAVMDELKGMHGIDIVFVGRKKALHHDTTSSFEYNEVTKRGVRFIDLPTGKLSRYLSLRGIIDIARIPIGIERATRIVRSEKPDRILSFGGYLALPVCIAGALFRIPVYTHEQTIVPGIANKIIARFAQNVFISFSDTKDSFPGRKVVFTGNPVRKQIFQPLKKPFAFARDRRLPVIYITGGSTGAHAVNILVEKILDKLLKRAVVIHQIGLSGDYGDFERLQRVHHPHYFPSAHFTTDEIGYVYGMADIVVCRAGANTVAELIALKKPAVLIPLPIAGGNEQFKHAQLLERAGVAKLFDQDKPVQTLLSYIDEVCTQKNTYRKNYDHLSNSDAREAAHRIVSVLLS